MSAEKTVKRSYRFAAGTVSAIASIADREGVSQTVAVERAVHAYARVRDEGTVSTNAESAPGGADAAMDVMAAQLSVKDAQIAALTSALASAQESVRAAQALQAASMAQIGVSETEDAAADADAWKSKGLLDRIFRR